MNAMIQPKHTRPPWPVLAPLPKRAPVPLGRFPCVMKVMLDPEPEYIRGEVTISEDDTVTDHLAPFRSPLANELIGLRARWQKLIDELAGVNDRIVDLEGAIALTHMDPAVVAAGIAEAERMIRICHLAQAESDRLAAA